MRTLLLLLAACTGAEDSSVKDTSGPEADADTDTDTDTDSDTDTDTDTDTDADTDTPPVLIDTGYRGPTRLIALVDGGSGAGTDASTVVVYDPFLGTSQSVAGLTVRADAVLDCAGDSLFVLETRGADGEADRILRVSPTDATYAEWVLGSNFQPRDVTAVADGYWVAAWGKPRLLTYDAAGTAGAFVDLSAHADADGIPEANGLYTAGPVVFVTLARQHPVEGTFSGARVLEIDTVTKTVTRTADLDGRYPSGKMLLGGDKLHVHLRSTSNGDGSLNADGGIEAVTVADFASTGLTLDDSVEDVRQIAVMLDPYAVTAWFAAVDAGGAPFVSVFSLFEGASLQQWPLSDSAAGIGIAEGTVWLAENPFTGGDGAIVGRNPADGAETFRVPQTGRVRAMTVCAGGAIPEE